MKSQKTIRIIMYVLIIFVGALLALAYIFKFDIRAALIVYVILSIFSIIAISMAQNRRKEIIDDINNEINASTKSALDEGKLGIVVYDSAYKITYMSDFFEKHSLEHTGEKVLNWLPELQDILSGHSGKEIVVINDNKYEITRKNDSSVLIFKDISKEYDLEKKNRDEAYVLGLMNYDNYDESNESEETITYVNTNIKIPVIEYFKNYGIVYRTLRNNRLQLILNYKEYNELLLDKFSILNTVRKEAKKAELDITLSMAFAMGYDSLSELDEQTSKLLELAQTRGGDQVVVKQKDKEAQFFGGSSEAKEKQSKVKARVMANTMKHLFAESSNVIIVGHSMADSDCIGSMLGMSCFAKMFNERTCIVTKSGEIEPMTKEVMSFFADDLEKEHDFISENEAINRINDDTLVIMCDHYSIEQSNCQALLKQAKKVMIVDHHRRKEDLDVNAILVYVEAGASSTSELVSEFFEYVPKIYVSSADANIMYLGIVIDTNHFRNRTGVRTFDAAKTFKRLDADPILMDRLSKEPYEMVIKRTEIISAASIYAEGIVIACMNNDEYPRSIASQASDALMDIKDIKAAFVICQTGKDNTIISARSNGEINVSIILEKMEGGGHMTAAGLQRKNTTPLDLKNELISVLDDFFRNEVINDESDSVK